MDANQYVARQKSIARAVASAVRRLFALRGVPATGEQRVEFAQELHRRVMVERGRSYQAGVEFVRDEAAAAGVPAPRVRPVRGYEPEALVKVLERASGVESAGPRVSVKVLDPASRKASRVKVTVTEDNRHDIQVVRAVSEKTAAAVQRHVRQAGREAVTDAVEAGGDLIGWARVMTGSETCSFCAMLASRGPVYSSEGASLFRGGQSVKSYHDHCDCIAVPVFRGKNWLGMRNYEKLEQLWLESTQGTSGKDAAKAFDQAYNEQLRAEEAASNVDAASSEPPAMPPTGGQSVQGAPDDDAVHRIFDRAVESEPAITDAVTSAAAAVGARMERLDSRVKTPSSIAEKLERLAARNLGPDEVTDAVRFTAVLADDVYWARSLGFLQELEATGMRVIMPPRGWATRGYRGSNVVLMSPDGQRFELQLHTAASLDAAERTHLLYEQERAPGVGSSERKRLKKAQRELFDSVPWPPGVPEVPS